MRGIGYFLGATFGSAIVFFLISFIFLRPRNIAQKQVKDFVGNSESFMLTVRGESMIEAGILDGDYILVKRQNMANNGEIVVALIGDEATVKTFYKEKDHIRLQPENSTMDPIIVPTCEILGKVAGVFRKM